MTRVGQYRLLERIGEGGMGAVFRGEDTMLQRQVAIKVLRPELSKQKALVERFRTEAVALARLNHPNIATVYGLLQEDGQYYMVLEYVDGETLEKRLQRRGRLPWATAVQIAKDALAALDHAHRMGVVHRDLKPSNLMVNRAGQLKVMDFGIARLAGTSRHTEYGRIVGTPLYMSPEQLRGEEVDGRSDVYSLGVVLYELLTGREAFEADSDYALLMAQLNTMPAPPSRFVIDLPGMLETALTRSLAKARDARWKSASDFRRALLQIVPEPVTRATQELEAPVEPKPTVMTLADEPATLEAAPTRLADPPIEDGPVDETAPPTRLADAAAPATRLGTEPVPATRFETGAVSPLATIRGTLEPMLTRRNGLIAATIAVIAIGAFGVRSYLADETPAPAPPPAAEAPAPAPPPPVTPPPPPPTAVSTGAIVPSRPPVEPPSNFGEIVDPNAPKPATPRKTPPRSDERPAPSPPPAAPLPPPPAPVTEPPVEPPSTGSLEGAAPAFQAGLAQIGGWLKSRDGAAVERTFTGAAADRANLLKLLEDASVEIEKTALVSSARAAAGRATADFSGTLKWRSAFGSTRRVPVRIAATFEPVGDGWRLRSWRFMGEPDLD